MNVLLAIGLLLIVGYISGWLLNKIGIPKIIGYILTGIAFSPNTIDFIAPSFPDSTQPVMQVCLAFIAFEVGGELSFKKIIQNGKVVGLITFFETLVPLLLVSSIFYLLFSFNIFETSLSSQNEIIFSIILGSLACSTAPAATMAVIKQYKSKGKVTDTILEVVALDDAIGIIYLSISIASISMLNFSKGDSFASTIGISFLEILYALSIGFISAFTMKFVSKILNIDKEGKWIVLISAMIILCVGVANYLEIDYILACMGMGMTTINRIKGHNLIFKIIDRYTEELIFLVFFLLSGLHLNISTLAIAYPLIVAYVLTRSIGKYIGVQFGAKLSKADANIRKYTAGGLIPQAGIVIGLVLSIQNKPEFADISELLLTTIMGATVLHELIGPITAKIALKKAGEIRE